LHGKSCSSDPPDLPATTPIIVKSAKFYRAAVWHRCCAISARRDHEEEFLRHWICGNAKSAIDASNNQSDTSLETAAGVKHRARSGTLDESGEKRFVTQQIYFSKR
jgi:hypothetical protein